MSLDIELKEINKTKAICHECNNEYEYNKILYSANITHNLNKMAEKAHIYDAIWRPYRLHGLTDKEDLKSTNQEIVYAKEIIPILKLGLKELKARPEYFKKFNAPNGWGVYNHFVSFVKEYLFACKKYPSTIIEVDR